MPLLAPAYSAPRWQWDDAARLHCLLCTRAATAMYLSMILVASVLVASHTAAKRALERVAVPTGTACPSPLAVRPILRTISAALYRL